MTILKLINQICLSFFFIEFLKGFSKTLKAYSIVLKKEEFKEYSKHLFLKFFAVNFVITFLFLKEILGWWI